MRWRDSLIFAIDIEGLELMIVTGIKTILSNIMAVSYAQLSEEILSLPVIRHRSSAGLRFDGNSPHYHLMSFLKGITRRLFWLAGWQGGPNSMSQLRRLKGSGAGRKALVVANGPSAQYLKKADLKRFNANGNEIFLVNDFRANSSLADLDSFHYVTSDPGSIGQPWMESILEDSLEKIRFVFCPSNQTQQLRPSVPGHKLVAFCDVQSTSWFRASSSIRPDRPRTYSSWTALKALSIAIWMGFDEVAIIGFDQSFVREVFSDSENRILLRETHAGEDPFLTDRTNLFHNLSDYFFEFYQLFRSLEEFQGERKVVNLDPHSLTTVFSKFANYQEGSLYLSDS